MINFFPLQIGQYQHDCDFHDDIVDRGKYSLEHYHKHLSKYTGRLARQTDPAVTVVDTFLILLAAANQLSIDLNGEMPKAEASTRPFKEELEIQNERFGTALEKLDHLESYPYRETMTDCIVALARRVIVEHDRLGIDTVTATQARWEQVEGKLPLRRMFRAARQASRLTH